MKFKPQYLARTTKEDFEMEKRELRIEEETMQWQTTNGTGFTIANMKLNI